MMNRRSVTYDTNRIRAPPASELGSNPDRRAVSDGAPFFDHSSGSASTPNSEAPDSVSDSFDFFTSSPPRSASETRTFSEEAARAEQAQRARYGAPEYDPPVPSAPQKSVAGGTGAGNMSSITPHLPHGSRLARPASKVYPYPSIQSSTHLSDYTLPASTHSPTLGHFDGKRYSSDPVSGTKPFVNAAPPISTSFSFSEAESSELHISPVREGLPICTKPNESLEPAGTKDPSGEGPKMDYLEAEGPKMDYSEAAEPKTDFPRADPPNGPSTALSFYTRPEHEMSGSPQKSVVSINSNAIGSLIETYDHSDSSLALSATEKAPLSTPALQNPVEKRAVFPSPDNFSKSVDVPHQVHIRQDSQSSSLSQASNASTITNNNQQRFVQYVMNQSSSSGPSQTWSMQNVLSWLKHHGFNVTWLDTFKRNEISGNRFLELSNYDLHSLVWRQLSMRLDESDDVSTIERFISLLHAQVPDKPEKAVKTPKTPTSSETLFSSSMDDDISEHRKSASSWSTTHLPLPAKPRPFSYIDPGSKASTKEHSHKFFNRKHTRTASFEAPKEIQPQIPKSASSEVFSGSRKSGIFSTLRKYGGEKAAEIKKQVQSPSLAKSNSQKRKMEPRRPEVRSDRSSKSISQVDLPSEISPRSAHSFSALRADDIRESRDTRDLKDSRESFRENFQTSSKTSSKPNSREGLRESRESSVGENNKRSARDESPTKAPRNSPKPSLKELLPAECLPVCISRPEKSVLVSRDNTAFVSIGLQPENLISAQELKSKLCNGLQLLDIGQVAFHVTDFHCNPGTALSDEALLQILRHDFPIKLYLHQSVDATDTGTFSSTSSDSKSFDTDNGKMYPATPQYLLQDPRDKTVDYLNFKDKHAMRKSSKSEISDSEKPHPIKLTMPQSRRTPANTIPVHSSHMMPSHSIPSAVSTMRTPPIHEPSSLHADSGNANSANPASSVPNLMPSHADYANPQTFTVLRRAGREIDFDKRRLTPNESKAPRLIPNIYSSSVTNSSVSPISASTIHSFREDSPKTNRSVSNGSENSFVAKRKPPPPPTASNSLSKKSLPQVRSASGSGKGKKFDFSHVPGVIVKDDDDEFFAKPIKKNSGGSEKDGEFLEPRKEEDDEFFMKPIQTDAKPMNVRPPVEEVYDNLEKYFPNTILDKPIIDTAPETKQETSPASRKVSISRTFSNANMSPVIAAKDSEDEIFYGEGPKLRKNMKTIRIVANEAKIKRLASMKAVSEARRDKSFKRHVYNAINPSLTRANTKLWGQKVVEVTSDDIEKGYVSRIQNVASNEYEELAWIKGELIGRGSFGSVFLALNVSTGEMLAVKQVELSGSSSNMEGIDALHKEVETMKDLDHLNIVQYLGFEQSKQTYSLFLEYVGGGSVASCLKSYGKFDEPLVKFVTRQVLEGLKYIHQNGILHRDLKADNLLLEIDGTCKISDFGISKKSQDIYSNNAEMSMQGTVFWMAPEVIHSMVEDKKQGYSAKVDIWSLGCVMVEMFAGKRPWSNEAVISAIYKLGKTKLAPPIPEEVSAEAKDFLNQCFTIDSAKRPTAEQLLQHKFMRPDGFDFAKTKLSSIIKYNSKKSIK